MTAASGPPPGAPASGRRGGERCAPLAARRRPRRGAVLRPLLPAQPDRRTAHARLRPEHLVARPAAAADARDGCRPRARRTAAGLVGAATGGVGLATRGHRGHRPRCSASSPCATASRSTTPGTRVRSGRGCRCRCRSGWRRRCSASRGPPRAPRLRTPQPLDAAAGRRGGRAVRHAVPARAAGLLRQDRLRAAGPGGDRLRRPGAQRRTPVRLASRPRAHGRAALQGGPRPASAHVRGAGRGEPINETTAMRTLALGFGVPAAAIAVDPKGVNTEATVRDTVPMLRAARYRQVAVVSDFFHLPRVKLAYERLGYNVDHRALARAPHSADDQARAARDPGVLGVLPASRPALTKARHRGPHRTATRSDTPAAGGYLRARSRHTARSRPPAARFERGVRNRDILPPRVYSR